MQNRRSFLALGSIGAGVLSPFGTYSQEVKDARSTGTSRVPKLRITQVQAVELRGLDHKFVRVHTDQGLTGTGEMAGAIGAAWMINEHLGPAVVGKDPLDIEAIYSHFWGWGEIPGSIRGVFVRGLGGPFLNAVSALEIALWDIAGKAMGVPLYRLFGGKVREKIPVYFWWRSDNDVRKVIQEKHARAFKLSIDRVTETADANTRLDPSKQSYFTITNRELDAIVKRVETARQVIGPDIELALECHARYNTESAIQIGRAVAAARPIWLEEPIAPDNTDALALVRRSIPVPVAVGENHYTRYGFKDLIEKQAASILQPDMSKCGGLLEARKIASMAETYHIPIAPHGTATWLGQMAYAHVCATIPNFLILEWGFLFFDELNAMLRTRPRYENGFVFLSEEPGIGIEVNDDAIREKLRPGFRWS